MFDIYVEVENGLDSTIILQQLRERNTRCQSACIVPDDVDVDSRYRSVLFRAEQIGFARQRVIITLNKQIYPFLATVAFLDWEQNLHAGTNHESLWVRELTKFYIQTTVYSVL